MAEAASGQPASRPLPPGLDLLWGRRERGKRGPRPGLSAEAIVDAAVRIADAEGLEAISMARVASELGFTTMSLYRYVASKDELLQLMFNASAFGAESIVLEGDDWRSRLRSWAVIQRDMLDLHPWITRMPMAAPPAAPNSLHFVERALEALDGTGLTDTEQMRAIGLITSYTLSEARMANDAARAMAAEAKAKVRAAEAKAGAAKAGAGAAKAGAKAEVRAAEAAQAAKAAGPSEAEAAGGPAGDGGEDPPFTFESLLRELVDERTYPRLYRLAWASSPAESLSEREEFLAGVDLILDGVQALVDRARRDAGEQ
ncbi:MAG TPA: TetR/AcrR family transcriptional regulator [Gemmataceae bacterium]|nr:TetR/AcrR family transcriptional regulator [Gemmataceae bacterium]